MYSILQVYTITNFSVYTYEGHNIIWPSKNVVSFSIIFEEYSYKWWWNKIAD